MGSCCFKCTSEKGIISPESNENHEMNVPANALNEYNLRRFGIQNYVWNEGPDGYSQAVRAGTTQSLCISPRNIHIQAQRPVLTPCHNNSGSHLDQSSNKDAPKQDYKQTILSHFKYLKDELDMDSEILDFFIQEDIYTQDQVDLINAERTRRNKVDCFLRLLLRSKRKAYEEFLEILSNIGNIHIRKMLEEERNETDIDCSKMKREETHESLMRNKETINNELEPELIMDYFVQYREFTIDEYEDIISEKTRRGKVVKFLKILTNGNHLPRGYFILLEALKNSNDEFLYDKLASQTMKKGSYVANEYDIEDTDFICNITNTESLTEDDSESMLEIKISVKSKNKGRSIMKSLTKPHVRQEICDRLFSDTDCLLYSVTNGSIIIRIKGVRKGSIKRLTEDGQGNAVSKILAIILSHPAVVKHVERENVELLEVKMVPIPDKTQSEDKPDLKGIIMRNIAFLREELDAIKFIDLNIFTADEKNDIKKERQTSRANGTKRMIDIALGKSEEDLNILVDEIKRRKQYIWEHMVPTDNRKLPNDVLTSNYEFLVESLYPSDLVVPCCQNDLLEIDEYKPKYRNERPRSLIAKYILHDIMRKGQEEIKVFIHIVSMFQPEMMALVVNDELTKLLTPGPNDKRIIFIQNEDEAEDVVRKENVKDEIMNLSSSMKRRQIGPKGVKRQDVESGYWSPLLKRNSGDEKLVNDDGISQDSKVEDSTNKFLTTKIGQISPKDDDVMTGLGN